MTSPHLAQEAEVSVIGAAMSGYAALDELLEAVDPSDFYSPAHEAIWHAIAAVHRDGIQPDIVMVTKRFKDTEWPKGIDPVRLFDMANACPIVSQAPHYAQQVAEAAGLRRIQSAGMSIQQLGAGDLAERREQARQIIDDATRGRNVSRARSIGDVIESVIEVAEKGEAAALPTGWADLDRTITGLAPGRLVIVGARPGVGKSLMGANLALHFAHHHGHAVHFASLEMTEKEVVQRMLACHARVNLTGLQTGTTDAQSWDRIQAKYNEISNLPITIDDAPDQTVTHIRATARNVQRQRDDLALIVVDYLQLMRIPGGSENRAQALGEVSRGLKLLARETGACVVAMAQLNREAAKGQPPKSADLRESGSIEADADQVILLHQPDDESPEVTVIVDKNRHGPKGQCTLQVQGHYASLASVAWSPTKQLDSPNRTNLTAIDGGRS